MLIKETTPPASRQFTITLGEDELFMLVAILGAQRSRTAPKLYGYEDLYTIVGGEERYEMEVDGRPCTWTLRRI